MLIPCPHCGPRDSGEFTYRGDATPVRPADDAGPEEWCAFLFERENPMGPHRELWQHTGGCRAVLIAVRDVRTHEVHDAALCGPHGTARPGPLAEGARPVRGAEPAPPSEPATATADLLEPALPERALPEPVR